MITGYVVKSEKAGDRAEFWYSAELEPMARSFARELELCGHRVEVIAQTEASASDCRNLPLLKTDAESAEYMREILPPVAGVGCFGVGEPTSHDSRGEPRRDWFGQIRGQWYAVENATRAEAEHAFARGNAR